MSKDHASIVRAAVSILVVACVAAAPLVALDAGGNINSRTGLENDTPSFRNSVSLFVRRNPAAGENAAVRWVLEGSVTAITTEDEDGDLETELVPDINIFRIRGRVSELAGAGTALRYRVGRIAFADPSRIIFSDRIDGGRFDLDLRGATVTLAAGYTGLIAGLNSGVVVSADDAIDRDDRFTYSGSRRVITAAGLRFPELIGRRSVGVGALAQFDTRGEYEEQRIHSQYGYLHTDGPIAGDLYHELGGAVGFAQISEVDVNDGDLLDPELTIGLSGRLRTWLYLGANEESVIEVQGRYATGPGDPIGSYVPVATPTPGVLADTPRSDMAHLMLRYGYRPFAGHPGGRARSLEVSVYSAVDYPADFAVEGPYRELEAGVRVTTRFFSDLGAQLTAGGAFPGDDDEDPRFLGRLDISTSF